nr:hypothetical protein [Nitrosomonas nitrosa]
MLFRLIAPALVAATVQTIPANASYEDPTILTVEEPAGTIVGQYHIDRLRSDFENVTIETRTPWTGEGELTQYRGPRIGAILHQHGLNSGRSVQFVAYDNFVSEVTIEEIDSYDPIFAIERACNDDDRASGRCNTDQEFTPLVPSEQGPIFLVWPYEQLPPYYVPARNSIWVWFVVAVRPVE